LTLVNTSPVNQSNTIHSPSKKPANLTSVIHLIWEPPSIFYRFFFMPSR
jgi:hypothetical protein